MNLQALMKQAQAMQKDMLKIKEEVENSIFEGSSSVVTVKVNGRKQVLSIIINEDGSREYVEDNDNILYDSTNNFTFYYKKIKLQCNIYQKQNF